MRMRFSNCSVTYTVTFIRISQTVTKNYLKPLNFGTTMQIYDTSQLLSRDHGNYILIILREIDLHGHILVEFCFSATFKPENGRFVLKNQLWRAGRPDQSSRRVSFSRSSQCWLMLQILPRQDQAWCVCGLQEWNGSLFKTGWTCGKMKGTKDFKNKNVVSAILLVILS